MFNPAIDHEKNVREKKRRGERERIEEKLTKKRGEMKYIRKEKERENWGEKEKERSFSSESFAKLGNFQNAAAVAAAVHSPLMPLFRRTKALLRFAD